MNGETESEEGGDEKRDPLSAEGEKREQEIAGDADGGDGDVGNLREGAVVDDAAVPLGVDVTGLSAGGVVNAEGERGNDYAREGQ